MVDARLPERYLNDRRILRLSDAQRSTLFMLTVWSVSNRTDGRIEREDLDLIPTVDPKTLPALVRMGLLSVEGANAWLIVDYERDQTTRTEFETLENIRRREREKKRRQRAVSPGGMSPGTVPGDDTGRTGQEGRTGKDYGEATLNQETGEVEDWPVAEIPDSPADWGSADAPGAVISR